MKTRAPPQGTGKGRKAPGKAHGQQQRPDSQALKATTEALPLESTWHVGPHKEEATFQFQSALAVLASALPGKAGNVLEPSMMIWAD